VAVVSRPRVALTQRYTPATEARARELFEVTDNPGDTPYDADGLRMLLATHDGVLCTVTDRLTREVLAVTPRRARVLANCGVGVNHIDREAAREFGLIVTNTPDVLTDDTADLAIALMLMTMRRLGEAERLLRSGTWTGLRPTFHLGQRLTGKRLGIIGYGRIGRAVAQRAHHGFGMSVQYWSPRAGADDGGLAERATSVEALLGSSDVVSLHCPATPDTRHLLHADRIARMVPWGVLINTARGDVVDEGALAEALHAGVIAGAGLDVYEREPALHPRLVTAPNTVLLPHLGSATTETRDAMGLKAVENLRAALSGEAPPDRVA
jgi:lactate dehydrogenase-like 2-hydroxyacid dehydrogenase